MSVHKLSDHMTYALGLNWLPPGVLPSSASENRMVRELRHLKSTPLAFMNLESSIGLQLGATYDSNDVNFESAAAKLAVLHP